MIADIQGLVDAYHAWLKDKTVLKQINDWVEITTPYLDRHNDYIQIYARRDDGGVLLTDDGYTLEDLRDSGCKLDSPKRQALLRQTLNGFGVQLSGDRIEVHATPENFALRKHNLVQAMLAVGGMSGIETGAPFAPDWVSPPGDTIADVLEDRDWTQAELARHMGYTEEHVSQIINGKAAITEDMALRLERVLGSTAAFWLRKESAYRAYRATVKMFGEAAP